MPVPTAEDALYRLCAPYGGQFAELVIAPTELPGLLCGTLRLVPEARYRLERARVLAVVRDELGLRFILTGPNCWETPAGQVLCRVWATGNPSQTESAREATPETKGQEG